MLSSAKRKWGVKPWKDMRNRKCILLSKRGQTAKGASCVVPTDVGKTGTVQRSEGEGEDEQVVRRVFSGQQTYSVWCSKNGYISSHLSKSIECTRPRVNPKVNVDCGWLWCASVGLSVVTNVPHCKDVDNGGSCADVEAGGVWEISVPSSHFTVDPKLF